jgi:23S rRNA (cytosine1962-C5)-methyltransferase
MPSLPPATSLATATVAARGRARVLAGHPWVFRQDVLRGPAEDAATGGPAIVRIVDERGRPLGLGTWAARAKLALRVLARDEGDRPPPVTTGGLEDLLALVEPRLGAARARRGGLALDRDAYRLVHGESDNLPGLFVDVYADTAVVQTTSVAMDALRPLLAPRLRETMGVRLVVAREDGSTRDFEDLPRFAAVAAGEGPTRVVYRLGPNAFEADLLTDGKTGGFLDQADNHAAVAALAPRGARCLDAFTYHGGFALALARRGGAVLATDESAEATARAAANAARNGLPNLTVERANAFDKLRALEAAGQRFDVVVLDPPAFAKRKSALSGADRAYKELFLRGLRLAVPGGLVVACSCSGRVTRAHFDELCEAAAADVGRPVQVLERRGASADHPERLGVPETAHLKVWILRAL